MKYILLVACLITAFPALTQVCNDAIRQNAFSTRYQIDTDSSVVIDQATGLKWQRCTVGYVFNDNDSNADFTTHSCDVPEEEEDTTVHFTWNWYQAIERATEEGGGWRLPNKKELVSLVEFACYSPAINTEIFPNTRQSGYWTNTPNASTDSAAWSINFNDGASAASDKASALSIRLVRD